MQDLNKKTIHFVGIGGSGMSAIAKVALEKGYKVTGSDLKESISTLKLKELGAKIFRGHKPENVREAGVVVVSTAIQDNNPEIAQAKLNRLPILRRAEMLNHLMNDFDRRISVCGTHGKTTTSSMITKMLETANKTPTFLIGAELNNFGSNAALGSGHYFVAESDESDGSFLCLSPNVSVVTNIESDHMDYFKDFDDVKDHFYKFMQGTLDRDGYLVLNVDDTVLKQWVSPAPDRVITVGINQDANIMASDLTPSEEGIRFKLKVDKKDKGDVFLKVFGTHNVYNALCAIAVGLKENIPLEVIKEGLFGFLGTKRRFQLIGEVKGIQVYDDYGHHPTEIKVTLESTKASFKKRVICIFQPHRYTRTRDLLESFPDAFDAADHVIITEIYSANERKIDRLSGKHIVERMKEKGHPSVQFIAKKSDIATLLIPQLNAGDIVLTMGAGDIHSVSKELVNQLKKSVKQVPVA